MLFLTDMHILFVKFNLQIRKSRGLSMMTDDNKRAMIIIVCSRITSIFTLVL